MARSDLEHVQITTLSAEQRELLEIYLERAGIPYEISADHVAVPEDRASDLYAALSIVVRARPSEPGRSDDGGRTSRGGWSDDDDRSPTEKPPVITRRRVVVGGRVVASRGRRFVGAVIDWLILDLWALTASVGGSPNWAIATTLGLYVVIATAVFGRTIGKFAVGTVVVAHRTGAPAGWLRSILRWLVTSWFGVVTLVVSGLPGWIDVVAFAVLVLTYAPVAWDRERRGWHDRAADTVVVLAKPRRRS
ncbi:MAG: hypothetical protein JWM34_1733 [Ilumatobacteraceae bacterium]|nr:hypothetical protein [Ilumatobacteraceae bacterium]